MNTQRSLIAAGSVATVGLAGGALASVVGRKRRTARRTVCADPRGLP